MYITIYTNHCVRLFAVASTVYVTVNFAPPNATNPTTLPTKGAVPDGTGFGGARIILIATGT